MDGEELVIDSSMVDIRVSNKEGYDVAMENNHFIILNTERTEELILEGIAREFVSKIQNLRKSKNLDIADRIKLWYNADKEVEEAFVMFKEYIMDETLSVEFNKVDEELELFDINGHNVGIKIEKNY